MIKAISPGNISGTINAPSSKSYAQRAIAASLLADGRSVLTNLELCNDTRAAMHVVQLLGAKINKPEPSKYVINGGLTPLASTINIGESGLSARMFTPVVSLCDVPITIEGRGTIAVRPMEMIIDPLRRLGVNIRSKKGHLPLTVQGPIVGGDTKVDGAVSSQFITGLLMALPLAEHDTTFEVTSVKSIPYIDMTLDVLESFGIEAKHNEYKEYYIEGRQKYKPCEYNIEGDWSGASCLLVAGGIAGEITIKNLNPISKQADTAIVEALSAAGAEIVIVENSITVRKPDYLTAFSFDATHCPDLFPALVALAANCDGVSSIKGTTRLLHKESDRAETLTEEYGKLGVKIEVSDNTMTVTGGRMKGAAVESHEDHRIAMSLAVAALTAEGETIIEGAECVAKSYPAFWSDLELVTDQHDDPNE